MELIDRLIMKIECLISNTKIFIRVVESASDKEQYRQELAELEFILTALKEKKERDL